MDAIMTMGNGNGDNNNNNDKIICTKLAHSKLFSLSISDNKDDSIVRPRHCSPPTRPIRPTGNDGNVIKQWSFWMIVRRTNNNNNDDDDNGGNDGGKISRHLQTRFPRRHMNLRGICYISFPSIPHQTKRWFYSSKMLIHLGVSKIKRNRKASVLVLCVCVIFSIFLFGAFVFLIAPQNRKNIVIELCVMDV